MRRLIRAVVLLAACALPMDAPGAPAFPTPMLSLPTPLKPLPTIGPAPTPYDVAYPDGVATPTRATDAPPTATPWPTPTATIQAQPTAAAAPAAASGAPWWLVAVLAIGIAFLLGRTLK
jgi:hypothetical protein